MNNEHLDACIKLKDDIDKVTFAILELQDSSANLKYFFKIRPISDELAKLFIDKHLAELEELKKQMLLAFEQM